MPASRFPSPTTPSAPRTAMTAAADKMPPLANWYIPAQGAPTIGFDHPDGSGFVAALDIAVGGPFALAIAQEVLAALQFTSRAKERQPEVERLLNWSTPMGMAAPQ